MHALLGCSEEVIETVHAGAISWTHPAPAAVHLRGTARGAGWVPWSPAHLVVGCCCRWSGTTDIADTDAEGRLAAVRDR